MKIEVYTKSGCPNCVNVKKYLDKKQIPYSTHDLSDDEARKTFYDSLGNGVRTMPVVIVDGVLLGGFNEVVTDSRFRSYVA